MCLSSGAPGGPRRCSGDGRAALARAQVAVAHLEQRHADIETAATTTVVPCAVGGAAVCSEPGCDEPAHEAGLCEDCHDDVICAAEDCEERNDDGEGFDGLCGNCADRAERQGKWS